MVETIAGIVANTCTRERGHVLYQEGMDEEPNEQGTAAEQGTSGEEERGMLRGEGEVKVGRREASE